MQHVYQHFEYCVDLKETMGKQHWFSFGESNPSIDQIFLQVFWVINIVHQATDFEHSSIVILAGYVDVIKQPDF